MSNCGNSSIHIAFHTLHRSSHIPSMTTNYHIYLIQPIIYVSPLFLLGDSISRDLFGTFAAYLGVQRIGEDELKTLTNVFKQKKLQFHSGDILKSEGKYIVLIFDVYCLYLAAR